MKLYPDPIPTITIQGEVSPYTATWVGNADGRHIVTPVLAGEDEVDPNAWGIFPSEKGWPRLRANYDLTKGLIVRLTSLHPNGGRAVGRILADYSAIEDRAFVVLSHGIGIDQDRRMRWDEALIWVERPAEFRILRTSMPDIQWAYDGKEVIETEVPHYFEGADTQFIGLDNPVIPKWKKGTRNGLPE